MLFFPVCKSRRTAILFFFCFLLSSRLPAQSPAHYEPTLESLDKHQLPQWYADAKLGISFIGVFIPFPDGRLSSTLSTTSPRRITSSTTLTRNGI